MVQFIQTTITIKFISQLLQAPEGVGRKQVMVMVLSSFIVYLFLCDIISPLGLPKI